MPNLGDVTTGYNRGLKCGNKYIWASCGTCGKERWVYMLKGLPGNQRCVSCSNSVNQKGKTGSKSHKWGGGRTRTGDGYIQIRVDSQDFFYSMGGSNHYALEHRIVMAKHLGRCLQKEEIVHHKNGIKDDNRLENLELSSWGKHFVDHHKGYQDGYEKGYQDGLAKVIELVRTELEKKNDGDV